MCVKPGQVSVPSHDLGLWTARAQDQQGLLPGVGQAVNVELALQAMNITKIFSRELLGRSLPVPDATLAAHQKALAAIAAKARQTRLQVRVQLCTCAMWLCSQPLLVPGSG